MARNRGGAGQNDRNAGNQWTSGYQFRNQEQVRLSLGPWKGVSTGQDADTLQEVLDGLVLDGKVYSLGSREQSVVDGYVLGSNEFAISGVLYHVLFYKNLSTGKIHVLTEAGTGQTDHASNIDAGVQPHEIAAVAWGAYIYFGSRALGAIYRYDRSAGTFSAAIAGSPANVEFLFVLKNNLVAVAYDSGVWDIDWTVDSDPEDWTGAGSGSSPFPTGFSAVNAVAPIGDNYYIVGQSGSVRMSSTGTLPAFNFDDVIDLHTNNYRGADSLDGIIYFIADDLRLKVFDGQNIRPIGDQGTFFRSEFAPFEEAQYPVITGDLWTGVDDAPTGVEFTHVGGLLQLDTVGEYVGRVEGDYFVSLEDVDKFGSRSRVYSLKRAGAVVVTLSLYWELPVIYKNLQQSGILGYGGFVNNNGVTFIADYPPYGTSNGIIMVYTNLITNYNRGVYSLDTSESVGVQSIITPEFDLGRRVHLAAIELEFTENIIDDSDYWPSITISYTTEDSDQLSTVAITGTQANKRRKTIEYPVHLFTRGVQVEVTGAALLSSVSQALRHINIVGSETQIVSPNTIRV